MNEGFKPRELNQRDLGRLKGYKELLDFYHGRQWPGYGGRGEKRLTFNYAKVVIDKVTSYLMSGVNLTVQALDDGEKAKDSAKRAEAVLRLVYEENNLSELDFDTEIDCAILGDACFKVTWDGQRKEVRVTAPDIQGIYTWWLGDDVSRLWQVASRYNLTREEVEIMYQVKARGKTASVVEVWTEREFELWLDDARLEKKPNPYGFIPFVIYPNLREPKKFWGIADLPQLMEPQREINRAMSQLSRILELSGNPIAVLENVEESEDIAVSPGAVWNIPEDAKAYLLDLLQGGAVGLHINYIDLLYRTLHDIAESPRAAFGGTSRDLSGVALEIELQPLLQKVWRKRLIRTAAYKRRARLILKLVEKYQNENFGRYSPLPAPLELGCQLAFSPGYTTSQGNEISQGQAFALEAYEHTSSGGKAALILYATGAWSLTENWQARHQLRWNKSSNDMSVKDILSFVLARAGLKLEVISQSSLITSFYPDFTVSPNARGATVIGRLLSLVPDVLFIEGSYAYLINPLAEDASVYAYGSSHPILEGRYRVGSWQINRLQVEGYDTVGDKAVIAERFSWDEIERVYDRFRQLYDRNIDTVAKAEERGDAYLREAEISSAGGLIRVPVNCGQQLYDVIDVTDSRAGLSAEKKRLLGIILIYNPGRGQYEQRLLLGAV